MNGGVVGVGLRQPHPYHPAVPSVPTICLGVFSGSWAHVMASRLRQGNLGVSSARLPWMVRILCGR